MSKNRTSLVLAALVVACFLLRSAHILFELRGEYHPFESEIIAHNLVEGRGYSYSYHGQLMPAANAPPGLVFALAALYYADVPRPEVFFRFLQALTACLALVLTWKLARHAFSERVAWVAAVLFLFDLNLSFTVLWVQETSLNILFTLAGLWTLVRLRDRPTWQLAVLCGVLFGLGILVRPTILIILLGGLCWYVLGCAVHLAKEDQDLVARSSRIDRLKSATLIFASTLLVLAPWTIRNALVFGRPIAVSQNMGLSLWYGNNPRATGSQVDDRGDDLVAEGALRERILASQSEVEIDRAYREAALEFIRQHPARALGLRVRCFAYYWLDHNYWIDPPPFPVSWRIKGANIILVGLFAVAVVLNAGRRGSARLLLVAIAASCLTYTMIHADVGNRYRMQIEPLMLVFIAQLAVQTAGYLRRRV